MGGSHLSREAVTLGSRMAAGWGTVDPPPALGFAVGSAHVLRRSRSRPFSSDACRVGPPGPNTPRPQPRPGLSP